MLTALKVKGCLAGCGKLLLAAALDNVLAHRFQYRLHVTARVRPLLVGENIDVDQAGQAVEFCLARHLTPRMQVVCNLQPLCLALPDSITMYNGCAWRPALLA